MSSRCARGGAALWVKSCFSFLEGVSAPEALVEAAAELGLSHLALTDRDGVYGAVRAHVAARERGLHLIHGAEVSVAAGEGAIRAARPPRSPATGSNSFSNPSKNKGEFPWKGILLVEDARGWASLCRLLSCGRLRSPKGESRVTLEEVCEAAGGLWLLWPGRRAASRGEAEPWPTELGAAEAGALEAEERAALACLAEAFGDRIALLPCRHAHPEAEAREARLRRQASALGLPVAAGAEVLYARPERRPVQDLVTAIRHGVPLAEAGRLLRPNDTHALPGPETLCATWADDPAALEVAEQVAVACTFSLSELRYRYPEERLPDGTSSAEWLRRLTFEGARARYGGRVPPEVAAQLEAELSLIEELDYPGYFLTMWEIVELCRARGILCQGRGSAANSAVCYCLGITAVDPVRMDLLFERFLSRERAEPPDIDLDIAHTRREEVIQWVYETYGRSHAAMVAVFITYRTRSAIRDAGKALGLPAPAVDRLARLAHRHDGDLVRALPEAGLDPEAPASRALVASVHALRGLPRHLSIHPGGFLLGHAPVLELVPVENGAMEGRTVIQWDKDDVDALGLFKVDLLGLGALTVVDRTLDLLHEAEGRDLTLATIPAEDPATYDLCCRGDTVGVFQIESRAQMAMLPRLKPRTFYDLVVQVAIVRPGPIAGDMVHPYLRRRAGEEAVTYPHPCLEPVLRRTLGVPLFQEQVMKLAVVAADYTPGEADQLRRDMAAWRRSGRIERHRERLISRMMAKGIARPFAERVFEQIRGFGEYGFPESHAASFALLAYATAYLKCHHPAAFLCALLDAQPMGFYAPATLVHDAQRHGVVVLPVDVLRSGWRCSLEPVGAAPGVAIDAPGASGAKAASGRVSGAGGARDPADASLGVRMGLRYVKGLPEAAARRLLLWRDLHGLSRLEDLIVPGGPDERGLLRLAEAGALESMGLSRREALWEVRRLWRERGQSLPLRTREPPARFSSLDAFETIAWDHAATRHSPRGHPVTPLREVLRARGLPDAAEVARRPDGSLLRYAGLVITRQRPGAAGGVVFLTLEDEVGFVNVIVWRDVFERFAVPIKTEPLLEVEGRLQRQEGVVHLIAEAIYVPELELPARPESRDFH